MTHLKHYHVCLPSGRSPREIAAFSETRAVDIYWGLYPHRVRRALQVVDVTPRYELPWWEALAAQNREGEMLKVDAPHYWRVREAL